MWSGRSRAWLAAAAAAPLAAVALLNLPSSGDRAGSTAPSESPTRSGSPAPETSVAALPPTPPALVQPGDGALLRVPGTSRVSGTGPTKRYTVAVESGLGIDATAFARVVEQTLADPRSWGARGRVSFRRVDAGPVAFRVVLASPRTTDRLCRPLRTVGTYSCASGGTAVVNSRRWLHGARAYGRDLAGYRQYVVNHEVGHTLGHGHERCPGPGRLAPVMVQQTKSVGSCRPNPWPFPA